MSVFDGSTKTPLRVSDPLTDKNLSAPGSLSFGGMTSTSGLASCTGIDAKLVHGDRWQQIDNNMTEIIGINEKTTIGNNETHTVGAVVFLTVGQGWQEEQLGPVNRHYAMIVTDLFDADHNVTVPDSFAFTVAMFSNTLVIATQIGICTGFFASICTALSVTLANFDLEAKMIHLEAHGIHGSVNGVELQASGAEAEAHGVRDELGAGAHVHPTVNAGVDIDVATPFT